MAPEERICTPFSLVPVELGQRIKGVKTLRAYLSLKLRFEGKSYLVRGELIYQKMNHRMKVRFLSPFGFTVAEVLHTKRGFYLYIPSEEAVYRGSMEREGWICLSFAAYRWFDGVRMPTLLYGKIRRMEFELRIKQVKANIKISPKDIALYLPDGTKTFPIKGFFDTFLP